MVYYFVLMMTLVSWFFPVPAAAEWIKCNNRKFQVDQPVVTDGTTNIYRAGDGEVILEDALRGKVRNCFFIDPALRVDDLRTIKDARGRDLEVVQASMPGVRLFFDTANGEQVYLETHGDKVVSSSEPFELPGKQVVPLESWYATNSRFNSPRFFKASTKSEWRDVWQQHTGWDDEPRGFDLYKRMVVAIFLGDRVNSTGVRPIEVRETSDSLTVYYDQVPHRGSNTLHAQPSGFILLEYSKKPIVFMERVTGDGPYGWKQTGQIP